MFSAVTQIHGISSKSQARTEQSGAQERSEREPENMVSSTHYKKNTKFGSVAPFKQFWTQLWNQQCAKEYQKRGKMHRQVKK